MQYDFSNVDEDRNEFVFVPEGIYEVRIAEVRNGLGRDGSERWGMRLEVTSGEFVGKTASWDWLGWSERGMPRVKRVLRALGLDVDGVLSIGPEDLVDLRARVQVGVEEREEPLTGRRTARNCIPYDGYAPIEAEDARGSNGTADFALS